MHTIRRVKKLVCIMTMGTKSKSLFLSSLMLLSVMLAGCVAFESTVNPRAVLQAYPLYIQEGETITLDARDSEAVEGVITDFKWNFGDGKTAETVIGFTSHTYAKFGIYTVTLTVENSGGGEDQVSVNIVVNGAPVLDLSIPENVKAGESALLDASASYDPEGKELLYSWDLDWSEDSNNDGDNRNDADAITPTVLLPTNKSGIKRGSLTISDGDGASQYTSFEVNISTRTFEVEWRTEQISLSWDGYLEQGASWEETITPGLEGRILSFEAVLELDQELGHKTILPYRWRYSMMGIANLLKQTVEILRQMRLQKLKWIGSESTLSVRMEHILQISPMMCFSNYLLNPGIATGKVIGHGQFLLSKQTQIHCLKASLTQTLAMIGHLK